MSKTKSSAWGPPVIYLGLGLSVISLIVIGIYAGSADGPPSGRPATLMAIGLPIGVVFIVIGLIKTVRDRHR